MLKCPMPGCCVVVAPERGMEHLDEQKGALMKHLMGDESGWWRCHGHNLDQPIARDIAESVVKITQIIGELKE